MKTIKVLFTTTSILVLILSLLLTSCGGSDKDSDSSSSKDKEGPASAPTATAPSDPVDGASYDLSIVCNEPKEVVSITGKGLDPDPQTHTCKASGEESFSLSLKQGVKFISPNNLTLSSMDEHGNSAGGTTTVDVPIDTVTLSIESAPMGTSLNAASYEVSGNCDVGQGDVTVTVETASPVMVNCTEDPAGAYTALLDISEVEADPMSVTVEQNGNTITFSPSPANDQDGPASAPTATAPASAVNVASYNLSIECNEAGEVVSLTGNGLLPNPQTHTCEASGPETFSLNIKRGVTHITPNELMLTSTDQYGNPAGSTTTVNIPIDTSALAPTVVIGSSLPSSIKASNARSFTVEGTCSEVGEPVMVSVGTGVGAVSPEIAPDCTSDGASDGVWTVDLDVTGLNKIAGSIPVTADHSSSKGEDATQASQSVTNNFICPANFVGVPSFTDYTINSFCVMKYEAKNEGAATTSDTTDDKPISQAAGTPWVGTGRTEAWEECRTLNTEESDAQINSDANEDGTYALTSNLEWMSLARDIENVAVNWTSGVVGTDCLFRGNVGATLPCGGVNSAYDGPVTDSGTSRSSTAKFTLSNGEEIWDLSGNAEEWVDWSADDNVLTVVGVRARTDGNSYLEWQEFKNLTKNIEDDDEMPRSSWEPTNPSLDNNNGIGMYLWGRALHDFSDRTGRRGGASNSEESHSGSAGVFSLSMKTFFALDDLPLGFRCVYRPRP